MNEQNESRFQFLPAILLLGLIGLLIAAAFILLSGIPKPASFTTNNKAPVAAVMDVPTDEPSATITATSSATPRPTWTLQPTTTFTPSATQTSTATATRVRIPTLTPARPSQFNDLYDLHSITTERMDEIVRTLADYPDAKFRTAESRNDPAYQAYFIYPALAFQEALLRFPDAPQTRPWQWGLAYSLAQLGSSEAVKMYAEFITHAMIEEGYSPDELSDWFSSQTQNLSLKFHPLPLSQDQTDLFLLEIPEGNVVYLLNPANNDANDILTPLSERFEFQSSGGIRYLLLDMNADGVKELALYTPNPTGKTTIATPHIYDLSSLSPQLIQIDPLLPFDYEMDHITALTAVDSDGNGSQNLTVTATFFPACPFSVGIQYQWEADLNRVSQMGSPEYQIDFELENLAYCEPLLAHAEAFWPLDTRLVIEQAFLPVWPPDMDPQGRLYPASALDELRFKNAVTLALINTPDQLREAQNILSQLSDSPADPNGPWAKTAQDFLYQLKDGAGLYQACQTSLVCDMRKAFERILMGTDVNQALASLPSHGAAVRSSGSFDFDQDGNLDRWLTIQPRPLDQLDFWILTKTEFGVQGLFIDPVETSDIQPFWSDQQAYPGIFQIESGRGYRLLRLSQLGTAYLEQTDVKPILTTYTRDAVYQAESDLMAGKSPAQVRDNLLNVLNSGRFNCINDRICDRFLYSLGLAYELAGNYNEAKDIYIQLWWENSTSPLTALARLKLNYLVQTATPTPTQTSTLTPTPTITPTNTSAP